MDVDAMWEEWLDKIKYSIPDKRVSLSNRQLYSDILLPMKEAFEAGFIAKRKLSAEEQLQK